MDILDFAASQGWAMEPTRVDELVNVVFDHIDSVSKAPEVLEAYRANSVERSERARERDGVGLLYVQGPLFKKANLMVNFSGATSYEILRRDLEVLVSDPNIHTIVQVIDSPGGQANGCDEYAAAVHEVNKVKPVVSFVSGMAASGGYWIAAAGGKIIVSDAAMLGSIGVVLGVPDHKAADERRGIRTFEFVSSQSPGKRPDPTDESGKTQIQTMVDDLAEVFISAVAKYRGVSVEDVVTKFGAGGMKIGAKAVAAGMADEVGQLEATIASLITSGRKGRLFPRSTGGFSMSDITTGPTVDENSVKARIKEITTSENGKLMPTLGNFLAFDSAIPAAEATKILAAAKEDRPAETKANAVPDPGAQVAAAAAAQAKSAAHFAVHKAAAGTLGVADRLGGNPAAASDGWSQAVKLANPR